MESHQKVNNFPATGEISRKDCLSKNIARLAQSEPEEFDFVPRGWIIPAELSTLQASSCMDLILPPLHSVNIIAQI